MDTTTVIIVVIIVSIGAFLILRELVCWYFKINERKVLLEEILAELRKLNSGNKKEQDQIYSQPITSKTERKEEPKKEKEDSRQEENEEDSEPDEPVEDPFWNKKK